MKELCIFICNGGNFSMSSLPKKLCWLHYVKNFHARSRPFPKALENNKLVILFWRNDLMENLPKSFGNLKKLEVLNLKACYRLLELPISFGGLQNLTPKGPLSLQGTNGILGRYLQSQFLS